jgi:type III secretion system low calcium response chaperone LcrH/SycD
MEPSASAAEVAAEWVDLFCGEGNPLTKLPEEKVKELHAIAHYHYTKQHYAEASTYYRILTMVRPLEPRFWKGLGACQQMRHDYQYAIDCYASAQLLNGDQLDPYLYVHAADCFLALERKEEALQVLEIARQWALKVKDKKILSHTKMMKSLWVN